MAVRESIAREKILGAIREAVATSEAIDYIRERLGKRLGQLSREVSAEQEERSARLARVEARIKSIIEMQLDGDRSPYLADMRRDFEAQAAIERATSPEVGRYVARAELLPLAVLLDDSEKCPEMVARGRFARCSTLISEDFIVPLLA